MVLIFDLDDTLYDERTYVESGLSAVACYGHERFGWNPEHSFRFMIEVFDREGRGHIFDRWLAANGRHGRDLVQSCVKLYRHHLPRLGLYEAARVLLPQLSHLQLYVVTDGHKIVQQMKVRALEIVPLFRRVILTHRYGIRHAKPSIHCFERIRSWERCDWSAMTYVGDNPAKDFVNLNKLGMNTVRVLTGRHKHVVARPGHDARHTLPHLGHFLELLPALQAGG